MTADFLLAMSEPQDVLAEALRATYDDGDGLGYRLVLMDESGGVIPTPLPDTFIEAIRAALVRTPETLDGTTTDCPLEGVHEHAFRGPHRFREWEPGT